MPPIATPLSIDIWGPIYRSDAPSVGGRSISGQQNRTQPHAYVVRLRCEVVGQARDFAIRKNRAAWLWRRRAQDLVSKLLVSKAWNRPTAQEGLARPSPARSQLASCIVGVDTVRKRRGCRPGAASPERGPVGTSFSRTLVSGARMYHVFEVCVDRGKRVALNCKFVFVSFETHTLA